MQTLHKGDPKTLGPYQAIGRLDDPFRGLPSPEQRFLARAISSGHTALVTVPQPELAVDPAFATRFLVEAQQAQRLAAEAGARTAWIAPVTELAAEEREPWHATAYVPALSLPEALAAHGGPLPSRTVRAMGAALAESIGGLHTAGFAHAGISPMTVLLTGDGPRLTGFGAVRVAGTDGQDRSEAPGILPESVAPEQLMGGRPRPLGDIYALGVVMAYAATGYLTPERSELPEDLRDVVLACLARDPAVRPQLPALHLQLTEGSAGQASSPSSRSESTPYGGPWPTQVDSAASLAQSLLSPGWLPGRVIAAIAKQAAETLAAEADVSEMREPADEYRRPPGSDVPVVDGKNPSESGPQPSETRTVPADKATSRRLLVGGVAFGGLGAALGFGTVKVAGIGEKTPKPEYATMRGVAPRPRWSSAIQSDDSSYAPRIWRDRIAVVREDTGTVGLDMRTGRKLWTANDVSLKSMADAGDGVLAVESGAGPLNFLSARTGQVKWRESKYDKASTGVQQVLGVQGGALWLLLTHEDDDFVAAYDPRGRKELWRTKLPRSGWSAGVQKELGSPEARMLRQGDHVVLAQSADGWLGGTGTQGPDAARQFVALRIKDGKELWAKKLPGISMESDFARLPGGNVVATVGDSLRAVGMPSGHERWKLKVHGKAQGFGVPAAHGATVYAADGLSTVTAVDAGSGKVKWRSDPGLLLQESLGAHTYVSPSGRTIAVVNVFEVVALDATNGKPRWRFSDADGSTGGVLEPFTRLVSFGDGVMTVLSKNRLYALPVA